MGKRAAIELPVNFLVILVISLVILGLGFSLFMKIYINSGDVVDQLGNKIKGEINQRLQGGMVVVLPSRLEFDRGKSEIAGVGIRNIDSVERDFKVFAVQSLYQSNDGEVSCSYSPLDEGYVCGDEIVVPLELLSSEEDSIYSAEMAAKILPYEKGITAFKVSTAKKKARPGQYTLNICVCHKGGCDDYNSCIGLPYDTLHPVAKLTVSVV